MKIILLLLLMLVIPAADAHSLLGSKDYSSDNYCLFYDEEDDIIEVCGGAFDIDELASLLDGNLLYREGNAWILNSSLSIPSGTKLYINDIWLKILNGKENHIEVRGELIIDGAKITSWDAKSDNYAILTSNAHRPHIVAVDGRMNITDAFIGYLGYDAGRSHGLDFYNGDHQIINTTIVGNYFGVYTDKIDSMLIVNSTIYDNYIYGIDLHTFSKNVRIVNNTIYGNGYHGIICSRFCSNIKIINNTIYDNIGHGIMFDKNVTNSIISNNMLINNDAGITLLASNNNTINNNMISNNRHGIRVAYGSSYNTISNNLVDDSKTYGIYLLKDTYKNVIDSNIVKDAEVAIYIDNSNATITNNTIESVISYNVRARNAEILFINNNYDCSKRCFFLDGNNHLLHKDDNLYNITYNAKKDNMIKIIDKDNHIYKNSLNVPQIISNGTMLELAINDQLKVNKEDIIVYADNPISLIYRDGVFDIFADTITTVTIENIENYHVTNSINSNGNNFMIVSKATVYLYDCDNVLTVRIDKYFETCSFNDIVIQLANYIYSINMVIAILIGFSIFSFIMIVKR